MSRNFEKIILEAIESKNELQFQYIFCDLDADPDKELKSLGGFSTFTKVLNTPKSKKFIEICIESGSDFYCKNSAGIFPLQYAIDSLCPENLETLIQSAKMNSTINDYKEIFNSMIINTKLDGGNNYLSFLINKLNDTNYDEVSKMIKIILANGCNINHPNDLLETPFYLMLAKFQNVRDKSDLITFCIDNASIDFYSHKSDDIISMMEARGLSGKIKAKRKTIIDVNFLIQKLDNNDEPRFVKLFEEFKVSSKRFNSEMIKLLTEAVVRGMSGTVEFLLPHCATDNDLLLSSAKLACKLGRHEVLKVLLRESKLRFKRDETANNLLHNILSTKNVHDKDCQKCFDLVIADQRCDLEIINGVDEDKATPLSLACLHGFSDIAKELMRRGAYIGHTSVIDNVDKDLLKDFLDECVRSTDDVSDKNCEVFVDFRFLNPPNVDEKIHAEMLPIQLIADRDSLHTLVLHPVIKTFLALKWRKISYLVYFNLLFHFSFLLFYGWFVVDTFRITPLQNYTYKSYSLIYTKRENDFALEDRSNWMDEFSIDGILYEWSFWISALGIGFMTINELIQCIMSFRKYFTKFRNYLDMVFLYYSITTLLFYFTHFNIDKNARSILTLMIAFQCIQVITRVSNLSLSLHMTIFKRVCTTFLKTFCLYMILIVAFALSFHSLFTDEKEDYFVLKRISENVYNRSPNETFYEDLDGLTFSNIFSSIVITVRMMMSDFELFRFRHDDDTFTEILFLLFVFLISIVLFNLLNALTISDTNNILRDAELVETKKTVSNLKSYEKLLMFLRLSFANILPQMSSIKLTPNSSNFVQVKQRSVMNNAIMVSVEELTNLKERKCFRSSKLFIWNTHIKLSDKLIEKIQEFLKLKSEQDDSNLRLQKINEDLTELHEAIYSLQNDMTKLLKGLEMITRQKD